LVFEVIDLSIETGFELDWNGFALSTVELAFPRNNFHFRMADRRAEERVP